MLIGVSAASARFVPNIVLTDVSSFPLIIVLAAAGKQPDRRSCLIPDLHTWSAAPRNVQAHVLRNRDFRKSARVR